MPDTVYRCQNCGVQIKSSDLPSAMVCADARIQSHGHNWKTPGDFDENEYLRIQRNKSK